MGDLFCGGILSGCHEDLSSGCECELLPVGRNHTPLCTAEWNILYVLDIVINNVDGKLGGLAARFHGVEFSVVGERENVIFGSAEKTNWMLCE